MSITNTYPFDDSVNYDFDSDKIEVTGGLAQLKLIDNTGLTFTEDFTDDTGFIYDSNKAEFTTGPVRQKDQRPANSIVGATFNSTKNANWAADGFSSLTAIENGSPVLSGNKLSCPAGANGLSYSDTLIGNLSGNFVAKFKFTPGYSGSPSQNLNIITFWNGVNTTDRIVIFHSPAGNSIRITANGLSAVTFDTWSPTASTEYTFEVICISNQVSLYIDNVQIGTSKTITPSVGTGNTYVNLGACTCIYDYCNGLYDDFILYSTASQTQSYTVPEATYVETKVELPQFSYSGLGSLQAFISLATVQSNAPQQIWNDKYWNGSAWVSSDGTFSQSNVLADILTNISAFPASNTLDIDVVFGNSNDQMSINNLIVTYTGQIYPTTNPILKLNTVFRIDDLTNLVETVNETGSDEIKYVLYKNEVAYCLVGSTWTISDETYDQSNTIAELLAQKSTFTTIGIYFNIGIFFHSNDGSTTPSIDELSITYDFNGDPEDSINICEVWFYARNPDGTVCTDTIQFRPSTQNVKYKNNIFLCQNLVSTTANTTDGYVEQDLIENANMVDLNGDPVTYGVWIGGNKVGNISVPNQQGALLWDILE